MNILMGLSLAAAIFIGIPVLSSGPSTIGLLSTAPEVGTGAGSWCDSECPPVASKSPSGPVPTISTSHRNPTTQSTATDPETLLTLAGMEFGVDPKWLLRVAMCESKLDVNAIGDGGMSLGLMQMQAHTFVGYSRLSGLGYTLADLTDPEAQSRLAAWAFSTGRAKAWSCR